MSAPSPRPNPRRFHPVARAARAALFELLEERRLMSVSLDDGGELSIVGTAGNDSIVVSRDPKRPGALVLNVNGFVNAADTGRVSSISISGLEGDDRVLVTQSNGPIDVPVTIFGQAGDDTLSGGAGGDVIVGGRGDDVLRGGAGGDVLEGHAGNDKLYGGPGRDVLRGNAGADLFYTGGERDRTDATGEDVVDASVQMVRRTPRTRPGGDGIRPLIDNTHDSDDGYTPDQLRLAYGLGAVGDASFTNRGAGQTIAVIIANDSPTVRQDLAVYSAEFGLPAPTRENFKVYYATKQRPAPDYAAAAESSLDVQTAHAIAPDANIILVEAGEFTEPGMIQAVARAAELLQPTGGVISMSYGIDEFFGIDYEDVYGALPANVSLVAASGDFGAQVNLPAGSAFVTAVGGTTLPLDAAGNRTGPETAWAGSGGGISSFTGRPPYQARTTVGGVPLGNTRAVPDLSFVADPATGVANYFTYTDTPGNEVGWAAVGGTSAGAPAIAGFVALINERRAELGRAAIGNTLNQAIYNAGRTDQDANFIDIDAGSNGSPALPGYDLVTGWGSPNGTTFIDTLANDQSTAAVNLIFESARLVLRPEDTGRPVRSLLFGGAGFASREGDELLIDLVPSATSGVSMFLPGALQLNRRGAFVGDGEIQVQVDARTSAAYRTRFVARVERRNRRDVIVGEFYAINRRGNIIYHNDRPLLYGSFGGA